MYKFAAASQTETTVFGAAKPAYSAKAVAAWIEFMQQCGIQRVCCLLPRQQLAPYPDLLARYQTAFGEDKVLWAPINDFHLVDRPLLLTSILPFLLASQQRQEKVVVHCSGGVGRTGHILAAWLVYSQGCANKAAIATVRQTGRNPYEAAIASFLLGRNPFRTLRELHALLDACRQQPVT